jgi:hypothetical protein
MGGMRAGTESRPAASALSSGGPAERESRPPALRGRWAAVAAYLLAAVVLFAVYLRLSETYALNSDSANILLMGWDLLHGHLLLQGWHMSDVSFYPTELLQYALLESFLGLHMQTAHVAAAMTYTLVFLLAVVLARSGSSGRAAMIRTLIAAAIMAAPQFGLGVFALDLSVGHIGTAVPLLLTWLVLDRGPRRWYVPAVIAVLLAWVLVADPIVYVVGVGPLGLVSAAWAIRGLVKGNGPLRRRVADTWYELSLGVAAVAATALAWIANNLIGALGGYVVNRLPFSLTPWSKLLHENEPAALWKVLEIFGADYSGLSGVWLALAIVHTASVLVVGWALLRVARRFFSVSLADEVLAAAIVLNIVLYLLTNASDEAAHEVAIIVPFGATLAARILVRTARAQGRAPARSANRVRLAGLTAGILVLAGYTAGLGYEISQPIVPPANTELAAWLVAHHLRYGLSGYWNSSSVTVDSGNRVQVSAVAPYTFQPNLWMSNVTWYYPAHYTNFFVLNSEPGYFSYFEPVRLVREDFGPPARTYHIGTYTVLVYDKNLLDDIPNRILPPISPGQLSLKKPGHDAKKLRPLKS